MQWRSLRTWASQGIIRIEEFFEVNGKDATFDPMLQALYRDWTRIFLP